MPRNFFLRAGLSCGFETFAHEEDWRSCPDSARRPAQICGYARPERI